MEQRSVTSAFHNEGGGSRLAGAFGAGSRSETWDRSGTGALLTRPLAQPRTRPHRSTLPLESPALAAGRVPSLDDALALALRRRGVPSRVRDTLPLAAASGARSNRAGRGVSAATVGAFRPSNFSMLEALPEPTVSVFDVNGDGSANGARGGSLLRPAASAAVASQTSEPFVPLAAQTPAVSSAAPARGLRPSAPARGALAVAPTSSDLEPLPEPNVTAFDIGFSRSGAAAGERRRGCAIGCLVRCMPRIAAENVDGRQRRALRKAAVRTLLPSQLRAAMVSVAGNLSDLSCQVHVM
eukprot:TRINITY_DN21886_c0_g4_i1.p1 TRINITY_DN21886_c0_g4~~TRINITY_DN21886_c0_g4_i1.p1  ORF type:complete len:297 (-),score=43.18 TRINITY_DN21886_c0_g4_i1:84-974(-)